MKKSLYLIILLLCFFDCNNSVKENVNEWIPLFNGENTDGWRGYNSDVMPLGWDVVDGILTFKNDQSSEEDYNYDRGQKNIIYALEEFDNFELYVEWKISKGGNSGIFYHIKEGYAGPANVAPEYQIIDDENYASMHDIVSYNKSVGFLPPDELHPLQKTASDYAMYSADPNIKKLNPAGQWNSSKIVFTEKKVEYWLNGSRVLFFIPWSKEWNEKKNSGKWDNAPDYGKFKKGYIGFQDHPGDLWLKNIKIKKL